MLENCRCVVGVVLREFEIPGYVDSDLIMLGCNSACVGKAGELSFNKMTAHTMLPQVKQSMCR